MCNARLYKFWNDLGPALKTGQPQNESEHKPETAIRSFIRGFAALRSGSSVRWVFAAATSFPMAEKFNFGKMPSSL